MEGKYSFHIINEFVNTDTCACGICWMDWRQAKNIINFKDECVNVNTIITDECKTLEKRNSDTKCNCTYIFSVNMMIR
jgi:hypothetical protein